MKVDEKALGCAVCRYRNGYVCDVCYKKIFDNKKGGIKDGKHRNNERYKGNKTGKGD